MKSFTTLKNLFTNLSQNTSSANDTLGGQLISDQHRYLIQKYFDNERQVTMTTVGRSSLTTTVAPANGDTSATLTASWTNPTGYAQTTFSDGELRNVLYTKNSTAISWSDALVTTATLTTAITQLGFQYYQIPANISKIVDDTINIGQQKFVPKFLQTRQEWDLINFLPYNSDIPNYCFIFQGTLGIFPIPSTTGNVITFNYKTRVPDLSFADYTTGTITSFTAGSTSVTGSGSSWTTGIGTPTSTDISYFNLFIRLDPPKGDGIWYPISQITADTTLTLLGNAIHTATTGATYTIAQLPLLSEDFHDMLVYGALMTYFSSIKPNTAQYELFEKMYNERLGLLEDYAGTKNVNVNLAEQPIQNNPNLFVYANS